MEYHDMTGQSLILSIVVPCIASKESRDTLARICTAKNLINSRPGGLCPGSIPGRGVTDPRWADKLIL